MTHRSRLGCIVIDCKTADLGAATRFWSGALGLTAEADALHPNYVTLRSASGEPRILLQAVEHDSRIHVDIETDDKESEATRLEALGATRIGPVKGWIVMQAPTGHRFCVVNPQRADFKDNAKSWNQT